MECSGRTQFSAPGCADCAPQRMDFGQGKLRTMSGTISAITVDRGAARLFHDGDIEVAFLGVLLDFRLIDGFQSGALEEARDRAFRRADARAFLFLAHIRLLGRNAVHGEREPARRGEGLRAFIDEPGLDQPVGDELLQILRRARLHARGDFFGEKFEQKIGHRYTAPPACVASQAAPQAFASSRTRRM